MHDIVLEFLFQLRHRVLAHQFKLQRPDRALRSDHIHDIKGIVHLRDHQIQTLS